jgi:hypothetical protein
MTFYFPFPFSPFLQYLFTSLLPYHSTLHLVTSFPYFRSFLHKNLSTRLLLGHFVLAPFLQPFLHTVSYFATPFSRLVFQFLPILRGILFNRSHIVHHRSLATLFFSSHPQPSLSAMGYLAHNELPQSRNPFSHLALTSVRP